MIVVFPVGKKRMDTIEIMFRCQECGLDKEKVVVRRRREGEDLQEWINDALRIVGRVHALRSLLCEATKVDLYLPMNPDGPIGSVDVRDLTDAEREDIRKALER